MPEGRAPLEIQMYCKPSEAPSPVPDLPEWINGCSAEARTFPSGASTLSLPPVRELHGSFTYIYIYNDDDDDDDAVETEAESSYPPKTRLE